jgi:hypothetical protein
MIREELIFSTSSLDIFWSLGQAEPTNASANVKETI